MTDHVAATIDLDAPIERVWDALTDHEKFGTWFRVDLDGPFRVGQITTGLVTFPGFEGCPWRAEVRAMERPNLFAFAWHPHAVDQDVDYSGEPMTLVEFRLESIGDRTRLTVTESGFDALPEARRWLAMRENAKGWGIQMQNVAAYVSS